MKRTFRRELDFYGDEHSAGGGGGGEGELGKRPQSVKTRISTTYGRLSEILTLQGFVHTNSTVLGKVFPCSKEGMCIHTLLDQGMNWVFPKMSY